MTKFAKISSIALMAAMLAAPASAATINLGGGGGGLVNLGGSGSGGTGASVKVDTGGILNDDDGGLLGLGGSGEIVAKVNLGGDDDDVDALIDLGGDADADVMIDLFGGGTDDGVSGDISVGLGDTDSLVTIGGDDDADVLLDLFGSGSGAGETTARVGLGLGGIGDDGVIVDLFGSGDGGEPGSAGGGGTAPGTGGDGDGTGMTTDGSVLIANVDANLDAGACFTPDATQISTLLNRHNYASSTAQWNGVTSVQVVEVGLCAEAQLKVAQMAQGSANYQALQSFIDDQAAIEAGLRQSGHDGSDVIAIDSDGSKLVIYVI